VRRGVRVTLVASALREPAFRRDMQALARDGVEVRELAMVRAIRPATDFAHLRALEHLLRALRPQVVHTHSSKAGVLGRLAAASTGIGASVHTPHTFAFLFGAMFGRASRGLFARIEAHLAGETRRFVAVSDDEAQTFARSGFIAAEKIRIVPNGVDPARWSSAAPIPLAEFGVPSGAPTAAVVGLLNVAKGQDLAVEALDRRGLERLHLLVLGDGETRTSLASLALRRGVQARVHLLGWRDDVPRFAKAVDFLIVPSRWEGMPYVVLEAMAAARPVVATRVDGARSVVGAAECGFLAEVEDVDSLAEAMRRANSLAPAERVEFGERGRRAVEARYTIEHMLDGLIATYAEVA